MRKFLVLLLAVVIGLLLAGPAHAAKPVPPSGTLTLVSDGTPAYGETVTFDVTVDPGSRPTAIYSAVTLTCVQDGVTVLLHSELYYLPGPHPFGLFGWAWTSGGAACTATLFLMNGDGSTRQVLDSLAFDVAA